MLISLEIGTASNDISIETAQCLGIGRMVRVWNACQERNSHTLSEVDLMILLGHQKAIEMLIDAGLGARVKGNRIRIKGTKGQIEWLAKARENGKLGADHGKKGGRPKETPDGVPNKPHVGLPEKPPPAPAPTPALTEESKASCPNSRSDVSRFADDSPEMKAARYLFSKILSNNPKAKAPNFQTWARQFDLIFRIDERDRAEVRRLIDWCQTDSFWLKNVLSPQTLRKQFDRLTVAAKNPAKGAAVGSRPITLIRGEVE